MEDISIQEIPRDASEGFSVTFRNAMKVPKHASKLPILEVLLISCLFSRFLAVLNEKPMKEFHHMALSEDILVFLSRFYFQL